MEMAKFTLGEVEDLNSTKGNVGMETLMMLSLQFK